MKITIEGSIREVAALALELKERLEDDKFDTAGLNLPVVRTTGYDMTVRALKKARRERELEQLRNLETE